MQIFIVSVGKIKEAYWKNAIAEYTKRLLPYAPLSLAECADLACPENASAAMQKKVKEAEGQALLKKIRPDDHVIALTIDGRSYESVSFAKHLERRLQTARGRLVFLIGGSLGLSAEVLARADETLSLSKMTFPHNLARVLLLEQLYRSFRILRGEPYHK